MTRTISLIIGIAVAALAVAVPTALGEGRLAGSEPQNSGRLFQLLLEKNGVVDHSIVGTRQAVVPTDPQAGVQYFKANELSTLVQQPIQLDVRTDAWDRTAPTTQASVYRDSIQPSLDVSGAGRYVDANQRGDLPTSPVAEPVSNSGTDFDWSQLGIGLGIGIALAFGLMLMFRATRHNRPLAH